jgi:hypothetical protein
MEKKLTFARFYEECAKKLGRIPDDELGRLIASYFGEWDYTIAVTTRRDMEIKKGYKITQIENGYLAELIMSPEEAKLKKHLSEVLAEADEIRSKLSELK